MTIYDILGTDVKSLVDEYLLTVIFSYKLNGKGLSSSVYFYRLALGEFSAVKKV